MKRHLTFITCLLLACIVHAQAVFESNASGNWNNPANWQLLSGTADTTFPAAGDSVIITNGYVMEVNVSSQARSLTVEDGASLSFNTSSSSSILTLSSELTVTGSASVIMNYGALTVSGNLTVSAAAQVTVNSGAFNVIGIAFINAPTASTLPSTGTSLINVAGGLFNCAGSMALTSLANTSRKAELRIGNSSVNIVGALTTTTTNSLINFTGAGLLTIAGLVTIPSASSFVAGNGKVLYVGIPGTDQTVAPLQYNRLMISGIGSGTKEINGDVVVTDTLTLLSDTLVVNSGGSLTLNDQATIVRTAGTIINTPVFAGMVNLVYNNVLRDTTGAEMPVASNVLQTLTIDNPNDVVLANDITVNDQLILQSGGLYTGSNQLYIANATGGAGSDPAVSRTNGYVNGTINRAIDASAGTRLFPLGIGAVNGYRGFEIEYTTAPSTGGWLQVIHVDATAADQSGLPLADDSLNLSTTLPLYWQAVASGGLTGGSYTLTVTAAGVTDVVDYTELRIVKRITGANPWTLNGTSGTNSGSNNAPVVVREGMSSFSQFAIAAPAYVLPVEWLSFTGILDNHRAILNWSAANPQNNNYYIVEQSTDGRSFNPVGQVAAITASGTFSTSQPDGTAYYRIKAVEVDGRYQYSNIISLSGTTISTLKVTPTAVQQQVTITGTTSGPIRLYNCMGQFVQNLSAGTNDLGFLQKGIYIIQSGQQSVRIIRQ